PYFEGIRRAIERGPGRDRIVQRIEYISDEDTEIYFKAADVLALPYRSVSQSGVLFLAYGFGLPVVASDVGSLREDIVGAETGFVCPPCDAGALASALETFFASDLFTDLHARRGAIQRYAAARYSWGQVAEATARVYAGLGSELAAS